MATFKFTELAVETQALILTQKPIRTDETALKQLITVNSCFRAILQPLLFRNINLQSATEAVSFLQIIQGSPLLSTALRVLQISFDLNPRSFAEPAPLKEFWRLWRAGEQCLRVLQTLTISYDPDDSSFLRRFLKQSQLLPGLRCLHLLYLFDCHPPTDRAIAVAEADAGPWDSQSWSKGLCSPALYHLEFLVVTTPVNPVWPPTELHLVTRLTEWFGGLPLASSLTTVVLLCGYENDGDRARLYVESNWDAEERIPCNAPLQGYQDGSRSWPPDVETSHNVPVVVCKRDCERGTWSEGEPADEYCGLGEWRFFDPGYGSSIWPEPPRISGYSQDIYEAGQEEED
ncbi:hypothetical protein C8R46DRAFT_1212498 [Mycena filopes]|nr:hypothetical protein C8R46DRAFT_1212498 [Mycena filopes]